MGIGWLVLAGVVAVFLVLGADRAELGKWAVLLALMGAGFCWRAWIEPFAVVWPEGGPITIHARRGELRIEPAAVRALYPDPTLIAPPWIPRQYILQHSGGKVSLPYLEEHAIADFAERLSAENPYADVRLGKSS